MKQLYIIPGFSGTCEGETYEKLCELAKGFEVKPIHIKWKYRVMSDYISEFLEQVDQTKEIYTLGFSYGAMISLIASSRIPIKTQLLCSTSPYFKQDLKIIPDRWKKHIGKRRVIDFENFCLNEITKNNQTTSYLFGGDLEAPLLINRVQELNKMLVNSHLSILEGVHHDISDPKYLREIEKVLKELIKRNPCRA